MPIKRETNRIKQNIENSHKSKLTEAGKTENQIKEEIVSSIEEINIDNDNMEEKFNTVVRNNNDNNKFEIEEITKEQKEIEASFILPKKKKKQLYIQKIYRLTTNNVDKLMKIKDETGMSENMIINFLIENGSKIIKIK
jgi:hypothetical protein